MAKKIGFMIELNTPAGIKISLQTGLFIDGKWREPGGGKAFETENPATEAVICNVAVADFSDINDAVASAKNAFPGWSQTAPSERADILFNIANEIEKNAKELAVTETIDMGMLYKDSLYVNIPHLIKMFRYYAGWITKLEGRNIPVEGWPGEHLMCYTRREPLGIVAGITPFNFPLVLSVSKIAPALATGNCFIHKPAPGSPLSAIKLAEVIDKAGIPPGVYNLVTGPDASPGHALTTHADVNKIALTGSTMTGRRVIKDASDTLKHVTVELGGKSPYIIFEDADIERAAEQAINAIYWNKGQVCVAGSRLLVEQSILDTLIEKLQSKVQSMVVGDPFDNKSSYGPMSSKSEFEKVMKYIEIGKKEGATLIHGGTEQKINGKGYYITPTLFLAENSMRIAREEIFGPVLCIIPFTDFDDAIKKANDSAYGLAAGVQSRSLQKAIRASELLQAGIIWLNTWHHYSPAAPFGGFHQSGYGRENGEEVLNHYTQTKTVWMDINS